MTIEELKERLQILLEQDVINKKGYDVSATAFEKLTDNLHKQDVEQAEMLFTHLPTALLRIENNEEVESPEQTVMEEVENSRYFSLAKAHVAFIEENWGKPLPDGEREFLQMHYTNVLNVNKGGD